MARWFSPRVVPVTAGLCVLGLASASAQHVIWEFAGTNASDSMGQVVAGVGDADGDGVGDIAGTAPGFDLPLGVVGAGQTVLVSGASGKLLQSWTGNSKYDGTNNTVGRVGDLDGDGLADVAVGVPYDLDSPTAPTFIGVVRLFSGATGLLIHEIRGDATVDRFGSSIDGVGDVNGDGMLDLIVGAMNADHPVTADMTGKAQVFSGADGRLIYTFYGGKAADQFGAPVRAAGDVDADGFDDLLIGARQSDNLGPYHTGAPGYAVVVSGATGQVLRTHTGTAIGDGFGSALDGVGDLNGDGHDDYAVGAPFDKKSAPAGIAIVYSGATGAQLYWLHGDYAAEQMFGGHVAGVGDINGDGAPDFSIGNQWLKVDGDLFTGTHVFSGKTGRLLTTLFASEFPAYAKACDGVTDLDGDGFNDMVLGDNQASPGGVKAAGQISVRGGNDVFLSALPFLVDFGDLVTFSVRGGPAFAPLAVALVDVGGAPVFHVVFTGALDAFGEWSVQVPVPVNLTGSSVALRAYVLSTAGLLDSSDQVLHFR